MESTKSSSLQVIDDPALAAFLLDPRRSPLITLFLGREWTVKDAATELGSSVNTTFVQVRHLLVLGFLREGQGAQRAGRTVKTYRSSAEGYFVPYEVTRFETLEALHEKHDLPLTRELARGVVRARLGAFPTYGTQIVRDGRDGDVAWFPALGPDERLSAVAADTPAVLNLWDSALRLSPTDAKALQLELREVYHRYRGRNGPGRYLLRLGLAPAEH